MDELTTDEQMAEPTEQAPPPTGPAGDPPGALDELRAGLARRAAVAAETASEGADPEAAGEPGDEPSKSAEGEPRLSRRRAAEEANRADVARLRAQWEQEREQREAAEARARAFEEQRAQIVERVGGRLGDPEEGQYLLWARRNPARAGQLSLEQELRAEAWEAWLEAGEVAEARVKRAWADGYGAVLRRPGIDAEELVRLSGAEVLPRVYEAAFEAGKAEAAKASAERISQLEAELAALRARNLGGLPGPERGGMSAGGWDGELPGPEAPAIEQVAAGLRRRLRQARARER